VKQKIKVQITYLDPDGPEPDPGGYCHATVHEYDKEEAAREKLRELQERNPRMKFSMLIPG